MSAVKGRINVKRVIWTVVFLGVTLAAIVMEVIAGIFHPDGTIPWTEYLARYVPWPIQLVGYVILAVWLPFHFWRHDRMRQVAYRRGVMEGWRQAARDLSVRNLNQENWGSFGIEQFGEPNRKTGDSGTPG